MRGKDSHCWKQSPLLIYAFYQVCSSRKFASYTWLNNGNSSYVQLLSTKDYLKSKKCFRFFVLFGNQIIRKETRLQSLTKENKWGCSLTTPRWEAEIKSPTPTYYLQFLPQPCKMDRENQHSKIKDPTNIKY